MLVVYFPLAHMVWGIDGFMNGVWNPNAGIKAIDFAGGTVVHMSSGWSALVLALIVGKRKGFGHENFAPHSLVLTMIGTGMLWVGWYGFNAGSAVAADGIAANAFMTTTLAAAVAARLGRRLEWLERGKPTVLGLLLRRVGGLVVITPAAGFVTASGAVIIGVARGHRAVLRVHQAEERFRLRRCARHLRRARRRRHPRRVPDRLLRHACGQPEPQHEPRRACSARACGSSN